MSRSNNENLVNPSKQNFEWSGDSGTVRYYDKANKKQVEVPLPFTFMVLEILSCITGWSDSDQSGIWSNEVKDLSKEKLTVRTFGTDKKKGREIASGLYNDIKGEIASAGGKYAASVYIAFKEGGKYVLGHFKVKGAALGAWIDYTKNNDVYQGAVSIVGSTEGKKGKTVYQIPTFKQVEVSEAAEKTAREIESELLLYLKAYFAKYGEVDVQKETVKAVEKEVVSEPADAPIGYADDPNDGNNLPF